MTERNDGEPRERKRSPIWMSPTEVGEELGMPWLKLRLMLKNGEIPAVWVENPNQLGGGRWRIPRKSLAAYIEEQERSFIELAEAQAKERRK